MLCFVADETVFYLLPLSTAQKQQEAEKKEKISCWKRNQLNVQYCKMKTALNGGCSVDFITMLQYYLHVPNLLCECIT